MADLASDPRSQQVALALQRTLDPALQRQATKDLESIEATPGFAQLLLQLIASDAVDAHVRFAGVVFFKNFVKRNWELIDGETNKISPADRAVVKSVLVDLMIAVPTKLQLQLSDAVGIIAVHDFPASWDTLIDQLVGKLTPENFAINNGVLQTAHPILKRWRFKYRSDALFTEINFVIERFGPAYKALFEATDARLTDALARNDKSAAEMYATTLLLLAKIFFSFNVQDLPAFFEEHQAAFFPVFLKYLRPNLSPLLDGDSDDEASTFDRFQTVVCEIAAMYAEKYAEDWLYLGQFVDATWHLLTQTSMAPRHDMLVARAMALLTSVVRRPSNRASFESPDTLSAIVNQIVVPNLTLRDSDEEMFEDEPVEFVRRDLDGSDADTRRRSAADLVKGLLEQFQEQVTALCTAWIQESMAQAATNVRAKDAAVALFMAVASKSCVTSAGITSSHVDVVSFFNTYLLADLQHDHGLLTVDSLRFIHMFRQQLTKEQHSQAMPLIARHLASPAYPVYTWAAVVLDVQLTQIFKAAASGAGSEVGAALLADVGARLGAVILREQTAAKVQENDAVMRALFRCVSHGYADAQAVLNAVAHALQLTVANPSNPKFSHYTFECVSMLVRAVCAREPAQVEAFEQLLFPIFTHILQSDVAEFMPYVFQVMAQMLHCHPADPSALPPAYDAMLPPLLQPMLWESHGNVPALVALVQAYLAKAAPLLAARNQLSPVLGIVQKLIASRANDAYGFELLMAVVYYVPPAALAPFRKPLLTAVLTRLSSATGTAGAKQKYTNGFIHFVSFYLAAAKPAGPDDAIAAFNEVQPGLFDQLALHVIIPALPHYHGRTQRRAFTLGWTRALVEARTLTPAVATAVLRELVPFTVHVAGDATLAPATGPAGAADLDELAYSAGFVKLAAAGSHQIDPLPTAAGAAGPAYLASRWTEICNVRPNEVAAVQGDIATALGELQTLV
ncbi:importin-alpha export receptor [Blastocladiella emersonii ATCC 22665]|nr:importin-alpha export receptor [Blastocladiella emersonii ATCC 22665]